MATILVVDDRELNRSLLTTLLGYGGHRLLEASSGPEGLSKVQRENPELIITDILMPDMDGYEFVRKVRTLPIAHQPQIIFYSATYLENEALALARACGVNRVICKPVEPGEMLKAVDEALVLSTPENPSGVGDRSAESEAVRVLSNKLYHKVKELEELNSELERRVAERTVELEKTNRSLQQQIIERQKAEMEAAKSSEEQLRTKSEFLSHVSHELRSPLGVVHQFTTILLDSLGGPLSPDQREYLEISLRNINQLKCMIDDLLEASRADVGKLAVRRSTISIQEAIDQSAKTHQTIAARKDIALITDVADHLPPVYADPARVSQILTNLLDNAIKFSPPKSTITLRAKPFNSDPSFVCVSVADCGCGIKPEHIDRIFDRLYQEKNSTDDSRQGLGLGLYICKQLVGLNGGSIWVETEPQKGSVFHFTLPVFSRKSLVAPLLAKDGRVVPFAALVTIQVSPHTVWPGERDRERALHRVQQVLERCILPDLDVLLPLESSESLDSFGLVARTDERGLQVLLKRVREQLSQCEALQSLGIQCPINGEVIDLGSLTKGLPLEKSLSAVDHYLQQRLQRPTIGAKADEQNTAH